MGNVTAAELKHRVRLEDWTQRIKDCRSSGQSVKSWCAGNGINTKTYYYWEKRCLANLSGMKPNSSGTELVRIEPQKLPIAGLKSVPAIKTGITIRYGNAEIIFPFDTDMAEIAGFIKLLG